VVGLLTASAQNPSHQTPSDNGQDRIVRDSVIDNSNIPDTAGSVVEDDNMVDTTANIENKDRMNDKTGNEINGNDRIKQIKPADKVKTPAGARKQK
jgi:hypothetical protein